MKSGADAKRDGSPIAAAQAGAGDHIQAAQRTQVRTRSNSDQVQ
jgi:hypothetical protein